MTHNRDRVWRTADGRNIPVKDMTLGHLVNVINWVIDNRNSYPDHVRKLMVAEATYRQTLLFASNEPYPQKVNGHWRIIDPKTGLGTIMPPPAEYIEAVKDNVGYQAMAKRTQEKRKKSST